jgi:hypothetical protein
VHVNRTLKVLREEGRLSFGRGALTIHDWSALAEIGDFRAGYLHLRAEEAGSGITRTRCVRPPRRWAPWDRREGWEPAGTDRARARRDIPAPKARAAPSRGLACAAGRSVPVRASGPLTPARWTLSTRVPLAVLHHALFGPVGGLGT